MKNISILIVEDEKLIALSLKRNLEDDGITVLGIADEGRSALAMLHQLNPDLVLMDVMIKGDLTGVDVAEKIREFSPVPIIFTSAVTTDDILTRAKAVRPYGYLVKPVNYDELKVTVEIAVSNFKFEQELARQKRFFCACVEAIPAGIAIADETGSLLCCNNAFCALGGENPALLKGRDIRELILWNGLDELLKQTGTSGPMEFNIADPQQATGYEQMLMTYNRVDDGDSEGILHIFTFTVKNARS